jgi:hypothetical protein
MNYDINFYLGPFNVVKEYGERVYMKKGNHLDANRIFDGRPILFWKHRGTNTLNELFVDFELVNLLYLNSNGKTRQDILEIISLWFVNREREISVDRVSETSLDKFFK